MGAYNVINRASMAAGQAEDVTQVLANFDAIATILNGHIDNSNIDAAAAILYSKLSLAGGIVNADINAAAAIAQSKIFVPAARAYHSVNQATASGVPLALALNSERFDTDTIHDLVTNNSRLTCKTAGKYQITANIAFEANATGIRQCAIRLNGVIAAAQSLPGVAAQQEMTATTLWDMVVNDYVELQVFQTSGVALNVIAGAVYSPELMMVRVA